MRQKNMEMCECDRCGAKEYLTDDSPNKSLWHDEGRIMAAGTTKPFLLCDACHVEYVEYKTIEDDAYSKWMRGGR